MLGVHAIGTACRRSVMAFFLGLLCSGLLLAVWQYHRDQSPSDGAEVDSVLSSNGIFRGKIWLPELGGLGATVSQPYEVWIENVNRSGTSELVFSASKTDSIGIKWRDPLVLEICYVKADIHFFKNKFFDFLRESTVTELQIVEVELRKVKQLTEC